MSGEARPESGQEGFSWRLQLGRILAEEHLAIWGEDPPPTNPADQRKAEEDLAAAKNALRAAANAASAEQSAAAAEELRAQAHELGSLVSELRKIVDKMKFIADVYNLIIYIDEHKKALVDITSLLMMYACGKYGMEKIYA